MNDITNIIIFYANTWNNYISNNNFNFNSQNCQFKHDSYNISYNTVTKQFISWLPVQVTNCENGSENSKNIKNNNNFDFFEKTKSSNYDYNYRNRGQKFFNQLVPNNDMNRIRNQNSTSKATVITDDSDLDYGSSIGSSGDGYLPNSYSKDNGINQNQNNNNKQLTSKNVQWNGRPEN